MSQFPRPKVVISRCIEFDHCRYDGSMISSDFVKALKAYVDFLPVCPEMEIGLGAPRDTVRIVSADGSLRLMQPATSLDLTDKMQEFTRKPRAFLEEPLSSLFPILLWRTREGSEISIFGSTS